MALSDIVRKGVALADSLTLKGGLQETVSLQRWKSEAANGVRTYAPALLLPAIVEHKRKAFRTRDGTDVVSQAKVTFLKPIPVLSPAVTGRSPEPVDERDLLVLANGSMGPILMPDGGLADAATDAPYVTQIYIG